ncbi:MAG: bacteriocin [Lysobacterales bacterium]
MKCLSENELNAVSGGEFDWFEYGVSVGFVVQGYANAIGNALASAGSAYSNGSYLTATSMLP